MRLAWGQVGLALAVAAPAAAQPCADAVTRWADACGDAGAVVQARVCDGRVVVVDVRERGAVTAVELRAAGAGAFVDVGPLGVSPVGEFPRFEDAPPATRRAFDRVVACVRADPSLPLDAVADGGVPVPDPRAPPLGRGPPWRLLLGLGLAVLVLARRARRMRERGLVARRPVLLAAAGLVGLGLATFVGRSLALPRAFFHQNGQGPLWVDHALCEPSRYGPGYAEVLGFLLDGRADPARSLFATHALLGAAIPSLGWIVARAMGARPPTAWALAALLAVEPVLSRTAQSETYVTPITFCLFAAAAALLLGARGRVRPDGWFGLAVVAAGLLVAQAARVHPVAWLPAATLPALVVAAPGPTRERLRAGLLALVGVGAVAALAAGPALAAVLSGDLGDRWLGFAGPGALLAHAAAAWPALVPAALLVWASADRGRAAVRAGLFVAVVAVAASPGALGPSVVAVTEALARPFLPVTLGLLASLVASVARTPAHDRALGAALLVVGGTVTALVGPALTRLPTDALEQRWLAERLSELPDGATVAHLSRAGRRVLFVPIYRCHPGGPRSVPLEAPADALATLAGQRWWYRSSLCSTPEGRPACDALERTVTLEPVAEEVLPARPSLLGLPYDRDRVEVGLYRVRP